MRKFAFAGLAALALGVSACASTDKPAAAPPPPPGPKAELAVSDQPVRRGAVVIEKVMMEQDGFVVIHETTADGKPVAPGSIGHAHVKKGTAEKVTVRLTKRVKKGTKLIAMLHTDTGRMGRYEFGVRSQAEDKPLMIGNAPVVKAFTVQ
jgi:hypothetical protein